MNNREVLQVIKTAIEIQGFSYNRNFMAIFLSLKEFITDSKIISEIERNNLGEALLLIDKYLFEKSKFKPYYFLSDLEQFDFEEATALTIDNIKEILKIELLQFHSVNDLAGNVTSYCQHWENQRRLNVRIEIDLMNKIKTDRSVLLTLKKQTIIANLGYYHKFTIKEYTKPKMSNIGMESDDDDRNRDGEEDYFYAMTDGQLGDYDDFIDRGGDIDDIDTWARG